MLKINSRAYPTLTPIALFLISGSLLNGVMDNPARADDKRHISIEEVVVTASKQEAGSQSVPVAVTALDENMLQKMNYSNLNDLSTKVPALSVFQFPDGNGTLVLFIRGVGLINAGQIARDPGVGVYLDDVYLGRAQGLAGDLADVSRIEVLRGPQGTLYGRNTIGGALKFVTAKPTGEFGLKEAFTVGNFGEVKSVTNINLPEIAGAKAKFTFLNEKRNGEVINPGYGPNFGDEDKSGYRFDLLWDLANDVSVEYALDHSSDDGTSHYAQRIDSNYLTEFYTTPVSNKRRSVAIYGSLLPEKDNYSMDGQALTALWNPNDATTLKSVTSYRQVKAAVLHDDELAIGIPTIERDRSHQHQYSQEFTLSNSTDRFDYVAGAYLFYEAGTQFNNAIDAAPEALIVDPTNPINEFRPFTMADFGTPIETSVVNKSEALYGQATWTPPVLDDNLSIIFGLRNTWDQREAELQELGVSYGKGHISYTSFDPTGTVDYKWTESLHTYIKASKAYRAGGFNNATIPLTAAFKPEKLIAFEAGLKSMWLNDRIRFNLALYHSSYKDIQTDFYDTNLIAHTVNAGEATIKGLEAELVLVPTSGLKISLDYERMIAGLDKQVFNPFDGTPLVDAAIPNTPKHKLNLDAAYTFLPAPMGEFSVDVDYSYTSTYSTDAGAMSKDYLSGGEGLLDASLTLAEIPFTKEGSGDLSASIWAKNLLNKEYVTYNIIGYGMFGMPRTYGLTLMYKY